MVIGRRDSVALRRGFPLLNLLDTFAIENRNRQTNSYSAYPRHRKGMCGKRGVLHVQMDPAYFQPIKLDSNSCRAKLLETRRSIFLAGNGPTLNTHNPVCHVRGTRKTTSPAFLIQIQKVASVQFPRAFSRDKNDDDLAAVLALAHCMNPAAFNSFWNGAVAVLRSGCCLPTLVHADRRKAEAGR